MSAVTTVSTQNNPPVIDLSCLEYDRGAVLGELKINDEIIGMYFRDKVVLCRGSQEAILSAGLAKPEWLPGMPGNGFTSNSVVFDGDGPRVVVGKVRGSRKVPSMHIRAWGYVGRTVEVRLPMTPEQIKQVEAFKNQHELAEQAEPSRTKPVSCRTEGNVVYLFGQNERGATP